MVELQHNHKIKVFQSDGGGEFGKTEFLNFLSDHGIVRQISCPQTPEQNGTVERKHRHIVEWGLTLLFHSKVPKNLWIDAFHTVVFLINRRPTPLLNMETPFKLLHGKDPDYSSLRTFGCQCFPYLRAYGNNKFSPKSLPCVFIGYSQFHKGYRCLYPSTGRVYISRHVVFNENHYPYANPSSSVVDFQGEKDLSMTTFIEWSTPNHYAESTPSLPITASSIFPCSIPPSSTLEMPLAQVNTSANANSSEPRPLVEESSTEAHVLEPNPPSLSPPVQSDSTALDVSSSSMHRCVKLKNGCPSSNASSLLDAGRHLSLNSHPMKTYGKTKAGLLHYSTPPSIPTEPRSLKSALRHPNWVAAMKEELQALHNNHTWTLVSHHPSMNVIGSKWLYQTKLKADGSLECLKARLVVKGFNQLEGVDYDETLVQW